MTRGQNAADGGPAAEFLDWLDSRTGAQPTFKMLGDAPPRVTSVCYHDVPHRGCCSLPPTYDFGERIADSSRMNAFVIGDPMGVLEGDTVVHLSSGDHIVLAGLSTA